MAFIDNEDGNATILAPNDSNLIRVTFYDGADGGYANLGRDDNDLILGGTSIDFIQLSAGTDDINGGDYWRDAIEMPAYLSLKEGNRDEPGAWLTTYASDLNVNLGSGTYSVNWREDSVTGQIAIASSGTLAGIESIYDSDGDDTLVGSNYTPVDSTGRVVGEHFYVSEGVDFVDGRGGIDVLELGQYQFSTMIFSNTIINVKVGTMRGLDGAIDTFRNIERFSMTGGSDTFIGDQNDNWVLTYGGSDTLSGGKGFDVLDYDWAGSAGSGVFADAETKVVTDGIWTDSYTGFEQIRGTRYDDTMRGSTGADDFFGNRGADTLRGLDGDDVLNGGDDNDTLIGGAGNDTLVGGKGVDTFDGGKGSDTLDYRFENPTDFTLGVNVTLKNGKAIDPWGDTDTVAGVENVFGTAFRDLIKGDKEDNALSGGKGRDNLGGLGGDDTMSGGDGKDSLGGGDGKDTLLGGKDDDTLFGGKGDDDLEGGKGDDTLFGEEGADMLDGGKGDDQLRDDKSSLDMYHFGNRSIRDALSDGLLPLVGANKNANHLMGKDGDDKVFGTGYLEGGKGKDELRGAGYLDGGKGDDRLFADAAFNATGSGYAVLSGGLGNDTLTGIGPQGATAASYVYSQTALTLNLLNGTASLGAGDNDTLVNVRAVFGTTIDDNMKGSVGAEENLYGLAGNDKITVRTSAKTLDTATGDDGADQLFSYGDGRAILSGGKGADKILVRSAKGTVDGGKGNDEITFFAADSGHVDTIDGGSGNDTIRLTRSGHANVDGGSGNDTLYINSAVALDDLFSFNGGSGRDTLVLNSSAKLVNFDDFRISEDKLKIQDALPSDITSFVKLKAAATDAAGDVRIDLKGGGALYLIDLEVADLQASMFDF